ncbi:MAG: hypothetical protein AVDCRST_MAG58-1269 [uncultured Rubrobacteraceae bacterium]|uniref:Uncharacterized protein n=1 Tax=uncultured Rubrobacteraceae bacterium TaxID=349277 RepID=A0A6J4R1C1_9ACTN|nr:MAG: hypothetical protein AVDCRST_MAG58-1269 [uncultured Rubrobacteraceae bacterium]
MTREEAWMTLIMLETDGRRWSLLNQDINHRISRPPGEFANS